MSLTVHLDFHSSSLARAGIEVDDTGDGNVFLDIQPEASDVPGCSRTLSAREARALAAALNHYASEVTP